jgi:hypothetical protein
MRTAWIEDHWANPMIGEYGIAYPRNARGYYHHNRHFGRRVVTEQRPIVVEQARPLPGVGEVRHHGRDERYAQPGFQAGVVGIHGRSNHGYR